MSGYSDFRPIAAERIGSSKAVRGGLACNCVSSTAPNPAFRLYRCMSLRACPITSTRCLPSIFLYRGQSMTRNIIGRWTILYSCKKRVRAFPSLHQWRLRGNPNAVFATVSIRTVSFRSQHDEQMPPLAWPIESIHSSEVSNSACLLYTSPSPRD